MTTRYHLPKAGGAQHTFAVDGRDLRRGPYPPLQTVTVEADSRDEAEAIARASDFDVYAVNQCINGER
jgi:hypothetical protein